MTTITETANYFQKIYKWEDGTRDTIHRIIRTLVQKGLVKSQPSGDGKGTLLLDPKELPRLRMFLVFTSVGFQFSEIANLDEFMSPRGDYVEESKEGSIIRFHDAEQEHRRLEKLIPEIRMGEEWSFKITLLHQNGRRCISAKWTHPNDVPNEENDSVVAKFREFQELIPEAIIEIPAFRILKPII